MKQLSLLIVSLFFFVTACGGNTTLSPLAEDAVILAFGDSITYGIGAAKGESYPEILEAIIHRQVIRSGAPGELTAEGLRRLPGVLDKYRPALLLLCHGGNDLMRKTGDAAASENLKAMVGLALERGIEVVLIAVPNPGISMTPPDFYKDVAREFSIPYEGRLLKAILSDKQLKADYIHPNAKGYRLMGEGLFELLREGGAL